jgi:hypothetical protein
MNNRKQFNCKFGILSITKGKKNKPAKMQIEIPNDLADKLMRGLAGIGEPIYGPVISWQEDAILQKAVNEKQGKES